MKDILLLLLSINVLIELIRLAIIESRLEKQKKAFDLHIEQYKDVLEKESCVITLIWNKVFDDNQTPAKRKEKKENLK